jgi:3-deoxy-manno-octulosonate cytidylyltransferase (CMP-KDO synthetase)
LKLFQNSIKTQEQFEDKNNVKVVTSKKGDAMYFSREPIPSPWRGIDKVKMLMQVGVIAFRRNALIKFNETSQTPCEIIESIDMNRVLESGGSIKTVMIDFISISVDTIEEAREVSKIMYNDELFLKYSQK